jgi:transcriptional regulator of acetoin/glycerol metabolism
MVRRVLKPLLAHSRIYRMTMTENPAPSTMPSVFSPLAKALLDGFSEGVVVFDPNGRILYANQPAREALNGPIELEDAASLLPKLAAMGGRVHSLKAGSLVLGEAMFIPGVSGPSTLADREREAIVKSLDTHNWKLAETAKFLGISRTTLWRRLKAYGIHRDGRSRWASSA